MKQRRVGVEQFRVLVAQGQGGLFELEVAVAQLLNLAARVAAVGRREQSGFQVVEVAVQFGDERGVVGRDAVEQYAEQVVRRPRPEFQHVVADRLRDVVEKRTFALDEAQHEVGALHQADLHLLPAAKEFSHDEHVAFVLLDLGRVVSVEDILHHQKVDTEPVADLPHGFGLFQPVHLKPDHPLFGELRFDRREAVGRVFVHLVRRITHQMKVGRGAGVARVDQFLAEQVVFHGCRIKIRRSRRASGSASRSTGRCIS